MLRQRLGEAVGTLDVATDGPAVRRRHAGYAIEEVGQHSAGVGRADDGPRGPIPVLGERLTFAADGVADGPAVRRGRARHGLEVVALGGAWVGRSDDRPRAPV